MKLKLSKLAVGLVAALAISGQAVAAPSSAGDSITVSQSINGATIGSGASWTALGLAGFGEIYDISLTSNSNVSLTALTSLPAPFSAFLGKADSFSSLTGMLFSTNSSFAPTGVTTFLKAGNSFSNLSAGSYILDVFATTKNSGWGAYKLSAVAAAPVPEPTEGALMLSGIGLLGFIASRRKKSA